MEAEVKLGEAKLWVAHTESIITARDKEIAALKDRKYRFYKGWLATVMVMGVPEDSPLRNLDQIPYSKPPLPTTQSPTKA